MVNYIQTTPEKWLQDNGYQNATIMVNLNGANYPISVESILRNWGGLIIDNAIETCQAHSDSEIDTDGARINLLSQFGLL